MGKKIKVRLSLVVSIDPESEEFVTMKSEVLSGNMKRELNEEYKSNGKGFKAHSVTFEEVKHG